MQVIDDFFDAGCGSGLASCRVPFNLVVYGARQCHHAIRGLHGQLLALQARILAELALHAALDLGVVRRLGAAHSQRKCRDHCR